jgi:SAM-dependent methyltransferase
MTMTIWKLGAVLVGLGLAGTGVVLYAGFGAFLPGRERAEAADLVQLADVRDGQTVAEIGAGGGRFSLALAQAVGNRGRVYASELAGPSYDALAASVAGAPNITLIRAERDRTNLPDGCCDLVLMRNVYHHVTNPRAFLDAVARALRPGGRVVVIDFEPGALWFHGGRPDDAAPRRPGHGVSRTAAIAEVEAAGFRVETSEPRWSRPMWLTLFRRAI